MKENCKRRVFSLVLTAAMIMSLAQVPVFAAGENVQAVKTPQTIVVDGEQVTADAYNIDGYNYFKLRDIAALLAGGESQFQVEPDTAAKLVKVTTGTADSSVNDISPLNSPTVKSVWQLTVDGEDVEADAYNINGFNYFKLRDLANAIGFGVTYDDENNSAVISSGSIVIDQETAGSYSGNVTIKDGGKWTVTEDQQLKELVVEGGEITADYPVLILSESANVENGEFKNNVQYVCDYDELVAIVHTNDEHGFIHNEAYVKSYSDSLKESGKYDLVLTVNGGDAYGGGFAAAHAYEGELIPALMSQIYDVMAPGNADEALTNTFYSQALLAALGESQGLRQLCGNRVVTIDYFDMVAFAESYTPVIGAEDLVALYDVLKLNDDGTIDWSGLHLENYSAAKGEAPLDGTMTVETPKGTKLGIFGINWQGRGGDWSGTDMPTIETCQNLADGLAAEGCTAVIGITHIGYPDGDETLMAVSGSNDSNSAQVALNTTGIDVIVDAHTHSIINDGEGVIYGQSNTFVNQAFCQGQAIGLIQLYLKDGKVIAKTGDLIRDFSGITPDAQVQSMVDDILARLEADGYTTILATTDVYLNGDRSSTNNIGGGVRVNETNLGDLVADGVLAIGKELSDGKAEISMYPGYWVRTSIEPGDITKSEICSIFANTTAVYLKEFDAQSLVETMQTSIAKVGIAENNSFKHISGFTVEYTPGEEENTLYSITVGDTLVYENGVILVPDDWSVTAAYTLTNPDAQDPAGNGWDPADELVANKGDLADLFCQYLLDYDEVIYDNVIAPDSRIIPHA